MIAAGVGWALLVAATLVYIPYFTRPTYTELPKYVPHDGPLRVVASVEVWADVARAVGGNHVTVDAIITNPAQDPHSYEATARDQLLVNRADLTVANGGFYDQFFSILAQSSPNQHRYMQADLTMASQAYANDASPVKLNDHIWYDLDSVKNAADELTYRINLGFPDQLVRQDIRNNARHYKRQVGKLQALQGQIRDYAAGKKAILTESFAAHLLHNLKITDATPAAFQTSVAQETDASPSVLAEMRTALAAHKVDVLIVNQQTESAQTNKLVRWAKAAGVPVVKLGELLPKGEHYLDWMRANLTRLGEALK